MGVFEKDKFKFSIDVKPNLVGSEVIEERKKEIELLNEYMYEYNVLLKDLVFDMPPYSIRNTILNISYFIIEDIEYFEYVSKYKKLPLDRLIKKIPITKTFLLKWSDYILVYLIILSNPNLNYLQEYLNVVENIKVIGVEDIKEPALQNEYQGIVINNRRNIAVILTSKGEFKKIKLEEDKSVGEEAIGSIKKSIIHYKLHISIFVGLIILMLSIIGFKYNSSNSTLLIETTSPIKLEINYFDRVIKEYSTTDKGKELIEKTSLTDEKLDDALYEIFKYALNNEMIPRDGILITVTGEAIKYGELSKFESFINENKLNVKFNNSGIEHKLN